MQAETLPPPSHDDLEVAASLVVASCLSLRRKERVVIVHDSGSRPVGQVLSLAAEQMGAVALSFDLDDHGLRPLPVLPPEVEGALAGAQASVFVASAPHRELGLRQQVLHLAQVHGLRHAHMPGLSAAGFARGMRVDYGRVARVGRRLLQKLGAARELTVTSPWGTDLSVQLDPELRWFAQLGVLEPGRWGNLPAGALYATPVGADGRFVATASLGEYFGKREGRLTVPVEFTFRDARVVAVHAPGKPELQREIEVMLSVAANSDRVGLVALGVNDALGDATGEAIVDQNLPGLHLAIGDPAARVTGASWSARTSFAVCQRDSTVLLEGVALVRNGRLLSME